MENCSWLITPHREYTKYLYHTVTLLLGNFEMSFEVADVIRPEGLARLHFSPVIRMEFYRLTEEVLQVYTVIYLCKEDNGCLFCILWILF